MIFLYCSSNVKDIHSVLEVTVYDEDRDHKVEFLGKVAVPLLRIRNGEKRWYALKDKKLYSRAKGNSPQILLQMNVMWNPVRTVAYIFELSLVELTWWIEINRITSINLKKFPFSHLIWLDRYFCLFKLFSWVI